MKRTGLPRSNQRGSAMLIVFVFAAIVAIGLFTELPLVIFEAQRNKEQLLVDRGNEYIQAVKLYRRKTGQFPPNLDALEKTNQVRFLRKKFVDPFTEKADWRLLHAGPNGTLTDSKLKLAQTVTGAGNSALGTFNNNQSSAFGGSTPANTGFGSGFNNAGNGFGNTASSPFGTNSGFGNNGNNGFGAAGSPSPSPSNAGQVPGGFGTPGNSENQNLQNGLPNPNGLDPNQATQQALPGIMIQPMPNPDGTMPSMLRGVGGPRALVPTGTNGSATGIADPAQTGGGFASSAGGFQNSGSPQSPNAAVGGLMSNANPAMPSGNGFGGAPSGTSAFSNNSNSSNSPFGGNSFGGAPSNSGTPNSSPGFGSSSSGFGNLQSGGLAGVASKVERHSIKIVNNQQDYSLWEFYYDPTKDPLLNAAGAALTQGAATNAAGQPGNSPMQSGNAFGQQNGSNAQSPFGQSNSFGTQNGNSNGFNGGGGFGSNSGFSNSGFGSTNNQSNAASTQQQPAAPPPTQPPQ